MHVIEELARQDGSVGWNVMIASHAAVFASYLPAPALREVYRDGPSTVIAGALPPKGAAIPVPGGFRLTGRWPFASGCHQAEWMLGPSIVMGDGRPRLRPDGRPDIGDAASGRGIVAERNQGRSRVALPAVAQDPGAGDHGARGRAESGVTAGALPGRTSAWS